MASTNGVEHPETGGITVKAGTRVDSQVLLDRLAELTRTRNLDVVDLERRAQIMAEILNGDAWAEAVETLRTGAPQEWMKALDALNGDRVARTGLLRRCLKWIENREGGEAELLADLNAALEEDGGH